MLTSTQRAELASGAYGIVRERVPLAEMTTFRLGGPCDLLIEVTSEKEILRTVRYLRTNDIPFLVIGNGSNLLIKDGGVLGVVVKMGPQFADIEVEGNRLIAQAGAALAKVAKVSFRAGLTGMEEISGIPGTVGGGVIMNAGAYGGEMKDVVRSIRAIDQNNQLVTLSIDEMDLGYRRSRMMDEGMIVTEITFELKPGEEEEIWARYREFSERRIQKQPLEKKSAGSTFKRPEGYYAGKLIQDSGLRGFAFRDAQVSEKHCGFVINNGGASTKDVLYVIHHVQETVLEKYGVALEPEIRILGVEPEEREAWEAENARRDGLE